MKRLDPQQLNVERIMSQPVLTIEPTKTLADASYLMSQENLTKLPVVDKKGELVGIITSTDIIQTKPAKETGKRFSLGRMFLFRLLLFDL